MNHSSIVFMRKKKPPSIFPFFLGQATTAMIGADSGRIKEGFLVVRSVTST